MAPDEAGKNSPFRDRSVEENLALFAKMKWRVRRRHRLPARQNRHGISLHGDA
ncbi:hypothetical protein ACNKHX_03915 [Shigella flexneri]